MSPDYLAIKILSSRLHFSDFVKVLLTRKELFEEQRQSLDLCIDLMTGGSVKWKRLRASRIVCRYLERPANETEQHVDVVLRLVKQFSALEILSSRWIEVHRQQLEDPRGEVFWDLFKRSPRFKVLMYPIGEHDHRDSQMFLRKFIERCRNSCPNFEGIEYFPCDHDFYTDDNIDMFKHCRYVYLPCSPGITDAGIAKLESVTDFEFHGLHNVHGPSLKKRLQEDTIKLSWRDMFWDMDVMQLVFANCEKYRRDFARHMDTENYEKMCEYYFGFKRRPKVCTCGFASGSG